MAAYALLQVQIDDAEEFQRYVELAGPTIPLYGGEVVVADDEPELVEGNWHGPRAIVLRFESKQAARDWYDSSEYREALAIRRGAATTNCVFAEGFGD